MHAISYETIIIYANHAKIKACGATYLLTPNQWRIQDFIFGGYRITHKGEVIWAPSLENF